MTSYFCAAMTRARRTPSMGRCKDLLLLVVPLACFHMWGDAGQAPPTSHQQLQFSCGDGSLVPKLSACDGHADCVDGTDERRCGHPCKNDEFACASARCVSPHLLCDGVDNCGDGSDEAPCRRGAARPRPRNPPACSSSEFLCGDGRCVPRSWRCDRSPDCSDGSDEENCDQDECRVNNGGCSHHCEDLPMGFVCLCPDDMKLVGDSQCEDVDACLESDVCDQRCVPVNGTLACACHQDYRAGPTPGDCRARGGAQLAYTSSKGVRWRNLSSADYSEPTRRLFGPGPLAAWASERMLYWARQGRNSINRVSMDTRRGGSSALKVDGSVSGLALDWIHRLLYWTSVESGSVDVGRLDGTAQRRLVEGLDLPSAVAVHPLQGLLFWAQCGGSPKIERSSLDGRDRTVLVSSSSIRRPVALSLDMPRQLLYWVDRGTKSISRVNLEGRHRKTVVESNGYLDRPFGLAVFQGSVYWSDELTQSVCRANKHDGTNFQVLFSSVVSPGGVVTVHPALQPSGPSVCGDARTLCRRDCVVDLLAERLEFRCVPGQENSSDLPSVPPGVPGSSSLSHPVFVGILAVMTCLIVLLAAMFAALWPIAEHNEFQGSLIGQASPMDSDVVMETREGTLLNPDLAHMLTSPPTPGVTSEWTG